MGIRSSESVKKPPDEENETPHPRRDGHVVRIWGFGDLGEYMGVVEW